MQQEMATIGLTSQSHLSLDTRLLAYLVRVRFAWTVYYYWVMVATG